MDKYRIIRKLSESATSRVSLAESFSDCSLVAIKELNFDSLAVNQLDHRANLLNESKILATLSHPNVIKLIEPFSGGGGNGTGWIVLEYCEGGDLGEMIRSGDYTAGNLKEIIVQLLLAVKYLHDRNILHRDLKLRNIFFSSRNSGIIRIKIGDFGISRCLTGNQLATTMVGTPYYLSPELCANQPYDKSIDIWSLGCVIYELINGGRHPFNAKTLEDLMGRIQEEPVDYEKINDQRMIEMLKRMLCKNPRDRLTIDGLLYLPLIQEYIQDFVSKLNTSKDIFVTPQPMTSPPPSSHYAAFSSTVELLNTMQTLIHSGKRLNYLSSSIHKIDSSSSFRSNFRDQLNQANQCIKFILNQDPQRLQRESDRVHQRLSRLLILPSRIQKFNEAIRKSDFEAVKEMGDEAFLKDIIDSGLVGDVLVMQEIIQNQSYSKLNKRI